MKINYSKTCTLPQDLIPLLQDPKEDHLYKHGATFDLVMNMYRFDRKLRILLFNEIEKLYQSLPFCMDDCRNNTIGKSRLFLIT
ncbi:hypothetical protein FACS189432_05770 [Bacteroidia bacterium]|nr:hypothetical protein FACS189426_09590 [Bacteroidia bacterium]GHT28183.1 hypothetical protein FACS189432_05770 [Bacteroidia bacterium]